MSVDSNGKLYLCAPTRPGEWLSWEQALYWSEHFKALVTSHVDKYGRTITQTGLHQGFMLNEADEFCIIDLDVKDADTDPGHPELWTTQEQFDRYWSMVLSIDSYAESSRSGKGLHIITEGNIGAGFRRDGVEIYSQERFMICTGNVVHDRPVQPRQSMLDNMVTQMRPVPKEFKLVELEEEEDDWSVLMRATNASNSDKFSKLWAGNLPALQSEYGFPSQSEADLALMSMLAFYSKSNAQCRRLFRSCPLGTREKAVKNDKYVNFTLSLIRERQHREVRADVSQLMAAAATLAQVRATAEPPAEAPVAPIAPSSAAVPEAPRALPASTEISWPPGIAGEIARDMLAMSVRPVKEISICATLGMLAGIVGKAWHIPQSGLNLYITLIGRSAVGKEALHSGISAYLKASLMHGTGIARFIDFTDYASGQALIKACVVNPSFVNVSGEWGRNLRRMAADDGKDGPVATKMTFMVNTYQKSGPASIVGGIGYSSTDNNVASVQGVNYSFVGETTPQTYFRSLTDSMMEDGFLSRFLTIEYRGERPDENEFRKLVPDERLVKGLSDLAKYAENLIHKDQSQPVELSPEARALLKAFSAECDRQINIAGEDESKRQMWNRAALIAHRIAAILAVVDNWVLPVISYDHMLWAVQMMQRSIDIMRTRLSEGDVGTDDHSRERKLLKIMHTYLQSPIPAGYKLPDAMRENSIVPHQYLQIRIQRTPTFTSHRFGANKALEDAVRTLLTNGYLMEVQKDKISDAYNFHGKAYRILKLPDDI